MKITVFTGNQPRHLSLINRLAAVSETTYAILECNTVFPGFVQDFFSKSETFKEYFSEVLSAEEKYFGTSTFTAKNVKSLAIKSGDLNLLQPRHLVPALESDMYIVFGSSFIKGWLIDFLTKNHAVNIHIGLSPYYRGSSCNFWALYDGKPEYVGATIHFLSKGLDSGPIIYHAVPNLDDENPFEFTMRSVVVAQETLTEKIMNSELFNSAPIPQSKDLQIRYSTNIEFTDEIAAEFLSRKLDNTNLKLLLKIAKRPELLNPIFR